MQAYQDFEAVLEALLNLQPVMFFAMHPTYCILVDGHVLVINKLSHIKLSLDDFQKLYQEEVFYPVQQQSEFEVDIEKDELYYTLRYK